MKDDNNNIIFVAIGIAVLIGGAAVVAVARRNPQPTPPPIVSAPRNTPTSVLFRPTISINPGQKQAVFDFTRPTPEPTDIPVVVAAAAEPGLCNEGGANNEPEILVGYSPASGESVGANGQIRVWVNDEGAPFIAPNEIVDASTGQITTPGDRSTTAPDGFLWEPALYIAPQTAETGGTPHFPTLIRGDYSNIPPKKGAGTKGAPIETPPAGTSRSEKYTAEFIWDVNSLGLSPGSYQAEFVIHDGDDDRGVGCINIVIQ